MANYCCGLCYLLKVSFNRGFTLSQGLVCLFLCTQNYWMLRFRNNLLNLWSTFSWYLGTGGKTWNKLLSEVLPLFCLKNNVSCNYRCLEVVNGQGPGQVQGTGPGAMSTNILHRNVHTGPGQGQESDPLSPIVPVPFLFRSRSRAVWMSLKEGQMTFGAILMTPSV